MEILLYFGHPCLFLNFRQKKLCLYNSTVMANLLQTKCLNGNPKLTYVFQSANTAFLPKWTNYVFSSKTNLCIRLNIFYLKRNAQQQSSNTLSTYYT